MSGKYFKTSRVLHSPLFSLFFFFQVKSTKSTNWKTKLTQKLHRFSTSQSLQHWCGPKSSKASHHRTTYEWRQQRRNLTVFTVGAIPPVLSSLWIALQWDAGGSRVSKNHFLHISCKPLRWLRVAAAQDQEIPLIRHTPCAHPSRTAVTRWEDMPRRELLWLFLDFNVLSTAQGHLRTNRTLKIIFHQFKTQVTKS